MSSEIGSSRSSSATVGSAEAATPSVEQGGDTSVARLRSDCRLLRSTAARLGMPFLLRRLVMVAVVLVIFWVVAKAILDFGAGVSYARLGPPDAAVVSLLERINPYLWATLVIILGLITFFWLRSAWHQSVLRERAVVVPPHDVRNLAENLSPPVVDVVRWVWVDHNYPLTQGDLKRALAETRSGRIMKTRLAVEQQAILGKQRPI